MGEGELKRRIMQLVNTPTSSVTPDVPEEIFPIVDEAKKDFPNFEGDSFLYAVGSEEAIKWFKKWFGDSE